MKYYKRAWLAAYILANLIGAAIFGVTGQLDGDLIGYPLPNYFVLTTATICVVASYFIWMGPVFNIIASIKVVPISLINRRGNTPSVDKFVGLLVLAVQACFLIYNFQEGVNVAGSRLQSDSGLKYIWIFFAPDALFLVYYGLYRESRLFGANLALYLISNMLRGWLGTWLIVFFIEGAYRFSQKRLQWRGVIAILAIFLVFLPVLIELKWLVRELGAGGVIGLGDISGRLLSVIVNLDWWSAFVDAFHPIVMRFQHLANVIGVVDKADVLTSGLANREFKYFFEEGLPQYTIEKMLGMTIVPDIHVMLLTYLIPEQLQIDTITNTHVGLVGWFWIAPYLIPVYTAYLVLLSWAAIWLAKKAGGGVLMIDVIWFAGLGYLMNGWFAAYIEFMQALVVLICIRAIAVKFSRKAQA